MIKKHDRQFFPYISRKVYGVKQVDEVEPGILASPMVFSPEIDHLLRDASERVKNIRTPQETCTEIEPSVMPIKNFTMSPLRKEHFPPILDIVDLDDTSIADFTVAREVNFKVLEPFASRDILLRPGFSFIDEKGQEVKGILRKILHLDFHSAVIDLDYHPLRVGESMRIHCIFGSKITLLQRIDENRK